MKKIQDEFYQRARGAQILNNKKLTIPNFIVYLKYCVYRIYLSPDAVMKVLPCASNKVIKMNFFKIGKALVFGFWLFLSDSALSATYEFDSENKLLRMTGEIVDADVKPMLAYLRKGVETIVVRSGGGSVVGALAMAKEINKRKIHLIVDRYCMSSCANYLFVAAYRKSLLPGAVLGFHGGIYGTAPIEESRSNRTKASSVSMSAFWREDDAFFKVIGFNKELLKRSHELTAPAIQTTTYKVSARGENYTFDSENEFKDFLGDLIQKKEKFGISITVNGASDSIAYFPDEKTLSRYGVKGIEDYPYPKDKQEMDLLAKTVDEKFQLIGDF